MRWHLIWLDCDSSHSTAGINIYHLVKNGAARVVTTIKRTVFESTNVEFFIAHVDITLINQPGTFEEPAHDTSENLNPFDALGEPLRALRGGGVEFITLAGMVL